MRRIYWLILVWVFVSKGFSTGIDNEIFVKLYRTKVERSKVLVNIAGAELRLAEKNFKRGLKLREVSDSTSLAISEWEIEQLNAVFLEKSNAVVKSKAILSVDKSLLKIAIDKVNLGIVPPICFELR